MFGALKKAHYTPVKKDEGRSESQERLLGGETRASTAEKRSTRRIIYLALASQVVVNLLWAMAILMGLLTPGYRNAVLNLVPSPARDIVSYEVIENNSTIQSDNPYKGRPNEALTKTWYESYTKWANIVVQEEDLTAIGRDSIKLEDGSGYLGTLEVFHQLHCLDYIRMYISRDYYSTAELPERRWEHADHCIDTIRLALMCHGDISILTFDWLQGEMLPFADFHVKHECRNWDNIRDWAQSHQANQSAIRSPASGKSLHEMIGNGPHSVHTDR